MSSSLTEIEVLIFTARGIRLAVDATQVESVLTVEQASDKNVPVDDMNDIMAGARSAEHKSPKVLLIKHRASAIGVVVERLEEIKSVQLDRIQPMPVLIEQCSGTKAVWGSMVEGDEVVLLVDFYRRPWHYSTRGLEKSIAG